MEIKTVGIDIGKTWFHLVACNRAGNPLARHKLNRSRLSQFIANLPPCLIGMGLAQARNISRGPLRSTVTMSD